MADVIAYKIGNLKAVMRDEPDFIGFMAENLKIACAPYRTADSAQVDNLADLFRGL